MKQAILLLTILLVSFSVAAQKKAKIKGNKNVVTEERTFDYFSKLEVSDKIELTLVQSNQNKLEIEADENLLDVLSSDVYNSTLTLSLSKRITNAKRFELTLYVEDLDMIELNDDSKVTASEKLKLFNAEIILNDKSQLKLQLEAQNLSIETNERSRGDLVVKADSLMVNVKESSKIKSEIIAEKLVINNTGSSSTELTGKVTNLDITASDNATLKAAEMITNTAIVVANDKSDSYINAKEKMEISAQNKAKVYVFNKPEITINVFEDNASIFKREAMTLLENL